MLSRELKLNHSLRFSWLANYIERQLSLAQLSLETNWFALHIV